ncbi:MAG: hypothetical protein M1549_04060 [Candidatus Dependentiae bacterium]|nr:hypothetical protein [Candidatus Dependentiae bacterium]
MQIKNSAKQSLSPRRRTGVVLVILTALTAGQAWGMEKSEKNLKQKEEFLAVCKTESIHELALKYLEEVIKKERQSSANGGESDKSCDGAQEALDKLKDKIGSVCAEKYAGEKEAIAAIAKSSCYNSHYLGAEFDQLIFEIAYNLLTGRNLEDEEIKNIEEKYQIELRPDQKERAFRYFFRNWTWPSLSDESLKEDFLESEHWVVNDIAEARALHKMRGGIFAAKERADTALKEAEEAYREAAKKITQNKDELEEAYEKRRENALAQLAENKKMLEAKQKKLKKQYQKDLWEEEHEAGRPDFFCIKQDKNNVDIYYLIALDVKEEQRKKHEIEKYKVYKYVYHPGDLNGYGLDSHASVGLEHLYPATAYQHTKDLRGWLLVDWLAGGDPSSIRLASYNRQTKECILLTQEPICHTSGKILSTSMLHKTIKKRFSDDQLKRVCKTLFAEPDADKPVFLVETEENKKKSKKCKLYLLTFDFAYQKEFILQHQWRRKTQYPDLAGIELKTAVDKGKYIVCKKTKKSTTIPGTLLLLGHTTEADPRLFTREKGIADEYSDNLCLEAIYAADDELVKKMAQQGQEKVTQTQSKAKQASLIAAIASFGIGLGNALLSGVVGHAWITTPTLGLGSLLIAPQLGKKLARAKNLQKNYFKNGLSYLAGNLAGGLGLFIKKQLSSKITA